MTAAYKKTVARTVFYVLMPGAARPSHSVALPTERISYGVT